MKKNLLLFCALSLGIFLSACAGGGTGYGSLPWGVGKDTGVVTQDPESMPDIAWQTPDQRQDLIQQNKMTAVPDASRPSLQTIVGHTENKREIKVALIVPLSGKNENLGQAMLKAAQMALFDVGSAHFEIVPLDTASSAAGAAAAANNAVAQNVDMVLGPIFADDVKAVKPILARTNIPVVAFTTDWSLADRNTYIMGFLPFLQVARVAQYAEKRGYTNFAAYAPQTEYCDVVIATLQRTGVHIVKVDRYSPMQSDLSSLVKDFAEQTRTGSSVVKAANGKNETVYQFAFNTLMLPVGGEGLRTLTSLLDQNGINQKNTRFIGTGLWDDTSLVNNPSLAGAWFAAPDPSLRRDFERRYKNNFGDTPARLASLAYDSTALAAVLARTAEPGSAPFDRARMTHPRGFAGIDGIFRFRNDGLAERGLAVLEIQQGRLQVVDPAPTAFISSGS